LLPVAMRDALRVLARRDLCEVSDVVRRACLAEIRAHGVWLKPEPNSEWDAEPVTP
jgi:hypothetical protein